MTVSNRQYLLHIDNLLQLSTIQPKPKEINAMKANKTTFKKLIARIGDWISKDYNVCISCGMDCDQENKRYALCTSCAEQFRFTRNICVKCGSEYKGEDDYCDMCKNIKRYFKVNRSCFPYKGKPKDVVLSFKFGSNPYKAKFLSSFLIDKYLEENYSADLVAFVPMSRDGLRQRGYNQSYLLAKSFSERMNIPLVDLFEKKNKVKKQEGLGFNERFKSVENAYYVKEGIRPIVEGKTILIIDDVFTTGSTMSVLSNLLLKEGAYDILGLTLCAVPFSSFGKSKKSTDE